MGTAPYIDIYSSADGKRCERLFDPLEFYRFAQVIDAYLDQIHQNAVATGKSSTFLNEFLSIAPEDAHLGLFDWYCSNCNQFFQLLKGMERPCPWPEIDANFFTEKSRKFMALCFLDGLEINGNDELQIPLTKDIFNTILVYSNVVIRTSEANPESFSDDPYSFEEYVALFSGAAKKAQIVLDYLNLSKTSGVIYQFEPPEASREKSLNLGNGLSIHLTKDGEVQFEKS